MFSFFMVLTIFFVFGLIFSAESTTSENEESISRYEQIANILEYEENDPEPTYPIGDCPVELDYHINMGAPCPKK